MLHETDAILIEKTLEGSLAAFDHLMVRYQKLAYNIARTFSREREHALDITQNVFLKAYQKLESLTNRRQFKAWLIRITYNECISWQRGYPEHQSLEELDDAGLTRAGGQERRLLDRETRKKVGLLLARLNPKHRLAVVLKYFEGLPVREIASVLECSEAVVKNMLYRSMRRLARFATS